MQYVDLHAREGTVYSGEMLVAMYLSDLCVAH